MLFLIDGTTPDFVQSHNDPIFNPSISLPAESLEQLQKVYRILVVDDEPDIASVIRMGFQRAGFKIDAYTNPRKALLDYKPGKYDLVLLDVNMPGLDGFQLFSELRKSDKSLRVIFFTACDVKAKVAEWFPELAGAGCVIEKPVSIGKLVQAIQKRLATTSIAMYEWPQ